MVWLPCRGRVVWYVCLVFSGLVGDVWCGMFAVYSVPCRVRVVWYVCLVFSGLVEDVWCGMFAL